MLLQWHIKNPGHSAKSAGGRLHLNMHTPLTQRSCSWLTMPLSRHSRGTYPETNSHTTCHNIRPQLSQVAEPLWTNPGAPICLQKDENGLHFTTTDAAFFCWHYNRALCVCFFMMGQLLVRKSHHLSLWLEWL